MFIFNLKENSIVFIWFRHHCKDHATYVNSGWTNMGRQTVALRCGATLREMWPMSTGWVNVCRLSQYVMTNCVDDMRCHIMDNVTYYVNSGWVNGGRLTVSLTCEATLRTMWQMSTCWANVWGLILSLTRDVKLWILWHGNSSWANDIRSWPQDESVCVWGLTVLLTCDVTLLIMLQTNCDATWCHIVDNVTWPMSTGWVGVCEDLPCCWPVMSPVTNLIFAQLFTV